VESETRQEAESVYTIAELRAENQTRKWQAPVSDLPGSGIDRGLADGGTIAVGEHRLKVHHAPGHTPDQVCFAAEQDDRIIVGDSVFEGGPGKTWSPEDFRATLGTLRRVILA
jgi:glyoxylase-like metal-dependent hydrolase (beta-lactamase superfamily II)